MSSDMIYSEIMVEGFSVPLMLQWKLIGGMKSMKINNGQLAVVFIVWLLLILGGCATIMENIPGFTHTASLIIGESKNNVLSQAEHILVKPKKYPMLIKEHLMRLKLGAIYLLMFMTSCYIFAIMFSFKPI